MDDTCRGIWLLRFIVFSVIVTFLRCADEMKSITGKLPRVDVFSVEGCVLLLHNKTISGVELSSTMMGSSLISSVTEFFKLLLLLAGDIESNPGPEGECVVYCYYSPSSII